jgi:drug/metabolite transporter (DMT)-like permease
MPSVHSGPLLTAAVALMLAGRDAFCAHLFQSVSLFEVTLWCFLPVVTVLFSLSLLSGQFARLIAYWRLVVAVNLTAAGNTILYFYALKLADPVLVSVVFGAAAWLVVFSASTHNSRMPGLEKIVMWLLAMVVALCVGLAFSLGHGSHGSYLVAVFGILLAIASAAINSYGIIYERKLSAYGVSAFAILSVRFLLVLVISVSIVAYQGLSLLPFSGVLAQGALVLVFTLVVLPALLIQLSIARTPPVVLKAIFALIPAMVLVFHTAVNAAPYSSIHIAVVSVYTLIALMGNLSTGWVGRHAVAERELTTQQVSDLKGGLVGTGPSVATKPV